MSLPLSRNETYVADVTPVSAATMNDLQDYLLQAWQARFGPGTDGAVAFDGTNTFSFASKSGSHYTLTRDVYATNMTFTNSAYLTTAGYRIYCTGTLSTSATALAGSVIINPGADSTSSSGGAGGASGSLGGGGAGGNNGANGTSVTSSYGGAGGDGDAHARTGGTVTAPTAVGGSVYLYSPPMLGYIIGNVSGTLTPQLIKGGGGGGGGVTFFAGGGGGGGVIAIAANVLDLAHAGDIVAAGGAGYNSTEDGGGGGGGVVILVYSEKNAVTFSAATNCPGGGNGGGAGFAGSNGNIYEVVI